MTKYPDILQEIQEAYQLIEEISETRAELIYNICKWDAQQRVAYMLAYDLKMREAGESDLQT